MSFDTEISHLEFFCFLKTTVWHLFDGQIMSYIPFKGTEHLNERFFSVLFLLFDHDTVESIQ